MSTDFSVVLAGPVQDVARVLVRIDAELASLNVVRQSYLCRVEFDKGRGVFDESEEEEEISFSSFYERMVRIAHWGGAAIEYGNKDFLLYILVARQGSEFINCLVDIPWRTLVRLFREENIDSYYSAIGAVAAGCRAVGGYGDVDLPMAPVKPNDTIDFILKNPEDPEHPCPVGLVSTAVMSKDKVKEFASGRFRVRQLKPSYWLLEENAYLEVYPSLEP